MDAGAPNDESAADRPARRAERVGTRPRITLLTDFGTADGYVAAMRGVIASIAPEATVEDASHAIEPGDVEAAAWALARYWDRYPAGTIHVVVVDPGVGGPRRPLAGEAGGRLFVAPDNGVLTHVLDTDAAARLFRIEAARVATGPVSETFHGRDIFAPAAALLAAGTPLDALGAPLDDPVRLGSTAAARDGGNVAHGAVVHIDRFGNLITNVPEAWLGGGAAIEVAGRDVGRLRRRYVDVESGEPVALVGSAGVLEIAVRDGSAADRLGVGRGAAVIVRLSASRG